MKLQLSAHMRNPRFNKDGSCTLSFTSGQEVRDDETIYLLNAGRRDELGWLLWSPNPIQVDDLPNEQATDDDKSPAKRQRAIIFLLWKMGGERGTFEEYYRSRMEKNITYLKSELERG